MTAVTEAISQLQGVVAPLKAHAARFSKYSSYVDGNGTLFVAKRPWIAPKNYLLTIFPGLSDGEIRAYESIVGITIPNSYAEVLNAIGGCFCFGLSLYGIPRSMLRVPPLLDRSTAQPLDLSTAVNSWSRKFIGEPGWFHFGDRHYSASENVGYFMTENGKVFALLKVGRKVGEWNLFPEFLSDELRASEERDNELHPHQWDS